MKTNFKIFLTVVGVIVVIIFAFAYYNVSQAPLIDSNEPSASSTDSSTASTTSSILESSIKGCYVARLSRDVYTLNIQSEENQSDEIKKVTGIIAYNNFEKDSSSGSFNGTFKDGILSGIYSFYSEGMLSDGAIIFKKVGDSFVQGFGPTKTVNGKESFSPISEVKFDPKSTFVKSEGCITKFVNDQNIFSFDYNAYFKTSVGYDTPTKDWRLNAKQNGILFTRITIPKTYMPKTNFSEAVFTIGKSTDANAIKTCLTSATNGEASDGRKTIGEYPFTKFVINDAGAGNFFDTTSYRGMVNGSCYVLEYTIHSTNIGNYSPGQGIKEFDKTRIQNDLEKIVESFSFLSGNN